jgi:hypothetical protein
MSKGSDGSDELRLGLENCINSHCPWSGDPVSEDSLTLYRGLVVGFCNPGCRDNFASALTLFDSVGHLHPAGLLPLDFTESPDTPPSR